HELFAEGNQVAWVASVPNSRDKYLALFNLDDHAPATMRVKWTQLDLSGQCGMRDLWQHKDLGNRDGEVSVEVRPHGARLFRIHPD
ncbi:MAG: alpha-galactosidase, partial [Terriglobia bacterium]